MPYTLQARVVFPVDRPPTDNGCVTVGDAGRILAVGPAQHVPGPVRDLGDVALLPGLVNAHSHLEFSDVESPLGQPGMPLVGWIRQVIAHRRRRSSRPAAAIVGGARESIAAGTTTLGEIAAADVEAYAGHGPLELTLLVEVIGFSRQRADAVFQLAVDRLDAPGATPPGARIGISPHAPYTVSPDLLNRLIELACRRDLPVAMHVAESDAELELLQNGTGAFRDLLEERSMWDPTAIPRGSRPLDYLRRLADAPRGLVIHGTYLDRDEHTFLADHADRMTLVYCPRTHAYFRHPRYPLAELLAAGVRVALGTDSRASNPDLSMFGEMRHVAENHPTISPESILRLATLAGAEALGRDADCGSITPGKWANLVALPLAPNLRGQPTELIESLLLTTNRPAGVWIHGHDVIRADY